MNFGDFTQADGNPRYRPLTIHQYSLPYGN
jgi:hypothetical protein